MYKFNNGNGAIICDHCRIIIKEPIDQPILSTANFHLCDKCKPDWYNKIYMEDVHSIALDAFEGIKKGFEGFGIDIENSKYNKIQDDIYQTICDKLEDYTHSEYRSHI